MSTPVATLDSAKVRARLATQAARSPLGNVAEFASTRKNSAFEKRGRRGLTWQDYQKQQREAMRRARAERWELQNTAAQLLPSERCAQCLRQIVPCSSGATINYSAANQSAHYGNLMVCGLVWLCPLCAAKITEERRKEMKAGVAEARRRGYRILMFTYTFSHHAHQALSGLLQRLKAAYRAMKSGRAAERFKRAYGVFGSIESLEVTWGEANGWHPHIHELVIVPAGVEVEAIASEARELWEHAAAGQGLTMNAHGFRCDDCDSRIADYIAKWGVEPVWDETSELTKWHTKRAEQPGNAIAGEAHYTPFGLLRLASQGNQKAAALFIEYAKAFKGRQQLRWSPKLRARLGLKKEKSDQEIAEQQEQQAEVLAFIPLAQWRVVLANDARGELLEVARAGDADRVFAFLAGLG